MYISPLFCMGCNDGPRVLGTSKAEGVTNLPVHRHTPRHIRTKYQELPPLHGSYWTPSIFHLQCKQKNASVRNKNDNLPFNSFRQSSWPVAVCHIHRRRGVLWRDLIQPRLDPEAGFGEHLLSLGVARLRDEVWWGTDGGNASTIRGTEYLAVAGMGTGDSDSLPAVKRLLADRERLKAAEDDARERGRGLWAESPESRGRDVAAVAMEKDGDDNGQRRSRGKYWWVGRAILGLFRRG